MPALISCLSCGRSEFRNRNARFCFDCASQRAKEQSRAIGAVAAAVQRGDMPPASTHQCVDCGDQAAAYDHRDYTRPFSIEPVCSACNWSRGPAMDSQCRDLPDAKRSFFLDSKKNTKSPYVD